MFKRSGSSDESIVGIEPVTGAALIFAMFKQLVDYREANEAANTTTTSRGWGWFGRCSFWLALTLATISTVLSCGATPSILATT
nr:hypothetical protein CFP56_39627 [Quercus suber]